MSSRILPARQLTTVAHVSGRSCFGTRRGGPSDAEAGTAGHSLKLNAAFVPTDEELTFITPGGTIVSLPVDDIVGKPYYFGAPATFANDPLDVVFVVYVNSPITNMMLATPKGGDLAAFSLSQEVLPGDPPQNVASLRVNVRDRDVVIEVVNKTPVDPTNTEQLTAAFDHTILAIP